MGWPLGKNKSGVPPNGTDPTDVSPIHAVPYLAGAKANQFQKGEMDYMLKIGVIDPVLTE